MAGPQITCPPACRWITLASPGLSRQPGEMALVFGPGPAGGLHLVLVAQFESLLTPAVVMMTVPLGIFGGLLGLWLTGQELSIYSQIGMIMLIGMVTKNGILIVEFINQLRQRGEGFEEAIIKGSVRRLRPILMTSLTAIIGAVPLMLSMGAGYESRMAVGTVVFFGLSLATLVTLLVVPAIYHLIARRAGMTGRGTGWWTRCWLRQPRPARPQCRRTPRGRDKPAACVPTAMTTSRAPMGCPAC